MSTAKPLTTAKRMANYARQNAGQPPTAAQQRQIRKAALRRTAWRKRTEASRKRQARRANKEES